MGQPYVGEIRMFGGNFAPAGWMLCEGQLLPISENETLFQLIGTTYGGDGQNTFALPDLRGRIPIHQGNAFVLAQQAGTEAETLTVAQIPAHTHVPMAGPNQGTSTSPTGLLPAGLGEANAYLAAPNNGTLNFNGALAQTFHPTAIQAAGGSQPHSNMQPYLCVHFIISLFGIFPSPT